MQTPFDFITGSVYEYVQNEKEHAKYTFNYVDKVLVWVVGFSIAAISAIVAKLSDVADYYEPWTLKTVLILLTVSVVCGIFYRIASLFVLNLHQNIIHFLEASFSNRRGMPEQLIPLDDENNIYEMGSRLKVDFGQDHSEIIRKYEESEDEEERTFYLEWLRDEYYRISNWASKQYSEAHDYVKEIYGKAYNQPKDKVKNITEGEFKSGKFLKTWNRLSVLFLLASVASFISVLLILVVNYQ